MRSVLRLLWLVAVCTLGFAYSADFSTADEDTSESIDFDKLFNEKENDSAEQVLEKKKTSNEVSEKAKQQTQNMTTPMTLLGGLAKSAFTCDDCATTGSVGDFKYGCKFCCEGQWGSCRSEEFQVNTPFNNLSDAMDYTKKSYAKMCKSYPFYSGGGGSASVGFPKCETYYYQD